MFCCLRKKFIVSFYVCLFVLHFCANFKTFAILMKKVRSRVIFEFFNFVPTLQLHYTEENKEKHSVMQHLSCDIVIVIFYS